MKFALMIGASILACASVSISNSTAHAQDAKPGSAVSEVLKSGTAIFDGHVFAFRITDRGVRTSGQIFPKPAVLTSEHNYVLDYQAQGEVSQDQLVQLANAFRADGAARCKELSNAEFADFKKSDASDTVKKSAGQLAEFSGDGTMRISTDSRLNPTVFICNAVIKVQID